MLVAALLAGTAACDRQQAPAPTPTPPAQREAAPVQPRSQVRLAVLPPDADDAQAQADGVARHLVRALGGVPGLVVIAPESSFGVRGSTELNSVIGDRLGATHLLRGRYFNRDGQCGLDLELLAAADGRVLWSGRLRQPETELPTLENEAYAAVIAALGLRAPAIEGQDDRPPGGSAQAYAAFLEGEAALHAGADGARTALAALDRAIELDPLYAHAYALRALLRLRGLTGAPGLAPAQRAKLGEQARRDAATARELAPDSALAHRAYATWLGDVALDAESAETEIRRGLALRPHDADLLGMLAVRQTGFGKMSEAGKTLRKALEVNPLSAPTWYQLGYVNLALADYAQAEEALRRAAGLAPRMPLVQAFLAIALFQQGRTAEAVAEARREPLPLWRDYALAMAYWANGERDRSDAALQALIRDHGDDAQTQIAGIYAQRDDREAMFRWLDAAHRAGDPGIVEIRYMPFVARYADDPRFVAILRDLDLVAEPAAKPVAEPAQASSR